MPRSRRTGLLALTCAAVLAIALPAGASSSAAPTASTVRAAAATAKVVELANLGGDITAAVTRKGDPRLYVTMQTGRVVAVGRNGSQKTVLDITDRTSEAGERGLLGIAFGADAKHAYLYYTDAGGDINVDEFAVNHDGTFNKATRRRVLLQEHSSQGNHNGGDLILGPDGYLYLGLGDGGGTGDPYRNGQRLSTLLGKILRIDPRKHGVFAHGIPKGNPFVSVRGAKKEIWAYGLRNPWRFSFDLKTHNLWIGDVGQATIEEVDHVATGRGVNFGWSAFEGTQPFNADQTAPNVTMPVYEYQHDGTPARCAITGGFVYRGKAIPGLVGQYLFADLCTEGVRALSAADPAAGEHQLTTSPGSIVSFAQGPVGEIYVLSHDGTVYRLVAA